MEPKNFPRGRDMEVLADLEGVQTRILKRISDLELSLLPDQFTNSITLSSSASEASLPDASTTEGRLSAILRVKGANDFIFKRVPSDYYNWSLEARRDVLDAASVDHLCKSIVLVNTQAATNVTDCSDPNNSKYYVVVVQYSARFNAETVKNFLYALNNGKIPKKKFNIFSSLGNILVFGIFHAVRLAPEEISAKLTGYVHNGVTCLGMKTDIPHSTEQCTCKLSSSFRQNRHSFLCCLI